MENWIVHLITQSTIWSLIIIFLISFFESLALIGLVLPGAILMASIGAMIGSKQISLYPAWIAGTIGCLLGDWLSYYIGWQFKKSLNKSKILTKYAFILEKIKYALFKYSMLTILFGKFVGHARPLIPLIAGMMNLSVKKIFIPSTLGCFLWPPLYFIPGILAGIIIDIPKNTQSFLFKIAFFFIIIILWLGIFLFWKWKNYHKTVDWLTKKISCNKLKYLSIFLIILAIFGIILIQLHPMMFLFRSLLWKIFMLF